MRSFKFYIFSHKLCELKMCESSDIEKLVAQVNTLETNQKCLQEQLKRFEEDILTLQNQCKCNKSTKDIKWVPWSAGEAIPKDAVFAGNTWENASTYVGRTRHNGIDNVCNVLPTLKKAYYSYLGIERPLHSCEVLTGSNFSWSRDSDGNTPPNAVTIGKHRDGVPHYVGRAHISEGQKSSLVPGVINRMGGGLYLPFLGEEHFFASYEVLVRD